MKKGTKRLLNEVSSMIKTAYPFLNESEHMEMLENFVCRCLEVGLANEIPTKGTTTTTGFDKLRAAAILAGQRPEELLNPSGTGLNPDAITPEIRRILSRTTGNTSAISTARNDITDAKRTLQQDYNILRKTTSQSPNNRVKLNRILNNKQY